MNIVDALLYLAGGVAVVGSAYATGFMHGVKWSLEKYRELEEEFKEVK